MDHMISVSPFKHGFPSCGPQSLMGKGERFSL